MLTAAALALASCTGGGSFPSPSLTSVLTPAETAKQARPPADVPQTETADTEEQLSETASAEVKTAEKPEDAPAAAGETDATAVALAPTEKVATPSIRAATAQANGEEPEAAPEEEKTADDADQQPAPAAEKKRSGLASLFSRSNRTRSTTARGSRDEVSSTRSRSIRSTRRTRRVAALSSDSSADRQGGFLSSRKRSKKAPRVVVRSRNGITRAGSGRRSALPGVRIKSLFGVDENERDEMDEPLKVASIASMARRGTHGLLLQRKNVQVGCFQRDLLRLLKKVERQFGRTPIVTSGYRSPRHNRMVRGARNSTHTRCMAADIQVQGVSKWALAKYLRSLPDRGGVGTYCHTKSVHIDTGSKRAWHHCRRSRGKKARKKRA